MKANLLFLIPQLLDLSLAAASFETYKISGKLEAMLFTKLKQLRFLLGTQFAVKKIVKAEWDDRENLIDFKNTKHQATIGSDFH